MESESTSTMENCVEFERFINVMADLIAKYADKIDLDSLPDPPKPTVEKIVGFLSFWWQMGKYSVKGF